MALLTPLLSSLPTSSSSARLSPSLRVLWALLLQRGSHSHKELPRPHLELPRDLLEQHQAQAKLLQAPSSDPRTLGPTHSYEASSSTRPR